MEPTTFIATVRESGRFDSDAAARETTVATLETLGECIPRGEAEAIAEQLPGEFAEHLLAEAAEEAEPLEYEDFLSRVSGEAGFDRAHAQARVQAVVAALEQTIDEFDYENLRGMLPGEYGPVFVTEAIGEPSLVETVIAGTDLDEEAARRAVRSTLETLGERLTLGEAEDLAAYLSAEEGTWLVDRGSPAAEGFSAEEFVVRVADREAVDAETARKHVRQVARGLQSLARAEVQRALSQLGPDYSSLF